MTIIKDKEDFCKLQNGNKLIGATPELKNTIIKFLGKNNILYCEEGIKLEDSNLAFVENNSLIFLGKNQHTYRLCVTIYNNSVFHMGVNNCFNKALTVILSEQKHCFIGDDCLFSYGICIRNADPHLIYDCKNKSRLNPSKSIFIGDHVWIGQNSIIFKGTQIDSGSIVGGGSIVSGKNIPQNTSWAGNSARQILEGIFWDAACVHSWTDEQTNISHNYLDFIKQYKKDLTGNCWIYKFDFEEVIEYSDIDKRLSECESSEKKLEYVLFLQKNKKKNRFVHRV